MGGASALSKRTPAQRPDDRRYPLAVNTPNPTSARVRQQGLANIPLLVSATAANTATVITVTSTAGLAVGMQVTGTHTGLTTYITAVDVPNSQITISSGVSATITAEQWKAWRCCYPRPTVSQAATTQIAGGTTWNATLPVFRLSSPSIGSNSNPQGATMVRLVTLTSGSTTITFTNPANANKVIAGSTVTGTGVPANTTIVGNPSTTTATMSAAATASGTNVSVTMTAGAAYQRVDTYFDGDKFELRNVDASANNWYRVWVDGAPTTGVPFQLSSSGTQQYLIDFGVRSKHDISVEYICNDLAYPAFRGFVTAPTNRFLPPRGSRARMFWVGDSGAVGIGSLYYNFAYPATLAWLCGVDDIRSFTTSGSGTGFVLTVSTGGVQVYSNRYTTDLKPQLTQAITDGVTPVVVLQHTLNDVSALASDVVAAWTAYVNQIQADFGTSVWIVTTSPWYVGTPSAGLLALSDAAKAAAVARGMPYVDFLRVAAGSSTTMFAGTGTDAAPTGDGDADWYRTSDGTHPNYDGHLAMASRYARPFGNALNSGV